MKIYSVYDQEFKAYGKIISGYDVRTLLDTLNEHTPLPEGVMYVPEEEKLQELETAKILGATLYGGLPVQFGWCNGHNTKLNCLEYHRDSEFNLGTQDFILLVAQECEMKDYKLDTSCVKAFLVPKGVLVEVYATTLHYAPCHAKEEDGFRVMVALPKGTNIGITKTGKLYKEDEILWATNKWLLAHPETQEAKDGAWVGLVGDNVDIKKLI